jgi:hypothetical protein
MEVEYVLLRDDLLAFFEYWWDHIPKKLRPAPLKHVWLWLFYLSILALVSVPLFTQGSWSSLWILGILAPFLFFLFFGRRSLRHFQRRALLKNLGQKADRNAKSLGWHRLSLGPEGITDATEFRTATYYWFTIEKIVITEEYLLIFDSLTTAFIVPQRAFPNEKAFLEFAETARSYRAFAQEGERESRKAHRKPPGESETGITPRDQNPLR